MVIYSGLPRAQGYQWFWIYSIDVSANDITSSHGLWISLLCGVNNELSPAIQVYECFFGTSSYQYLGLFPLILTPPTSMERADSKPLAWSQLMISRRAALFCQVLYKIDCGLWANEGRLRRKCKRGVSLRGQHWAKGRVTAFRQTAAGIKGLWRPRFRMWPLTKKAKPGVLWNNQSKERTRLWYEVQIWSTSLALSSKDQVPHFTVTGTHYPSS